MSPEDRAEREQAEREPVDDDAGTDAEERWFALYDGWVQ